MTMTMPHGVGRLLQRQDAGPMANRGTIINVTSWLLLAVVACVLVARLAMKLSMKTIRRTFGLDDLFVGLAAACSFGQTIAISIQSLHGLGQHASDLSASQMSTYQKAEYAACILYIANMGCARISICLLIRKVLPGLLAKYTLLALVAFTAAWTVTGMIASAFPCSLPSPWKSSQSADCFNVIAFINYIGTTNIVLEVLLVAVPLFVWNIRLSAGRRLSVSLVFLARLSIVATIGAQLHFFNSLVSGDFTYDLWTAVLCEQIAQNLSVISACLPCLHPFIISILAGTVTPETITLNAPPCIRQYLSKRSMNFDPTSSQASQISTAPLTDKSAPEPYCRPLATWGLDRLSRDNYPQPVVRFAYNIATPIFSGSPPENVFNRQIELPQSRGATSSSVPSITPKTLFEVGVLPAADWDTDGSDTSGTLRPRSSEYVFSREKVISVSEDSLYGERNRKT